MNEWADQWNSSADNGGGGQEPPLPPGLSPRGGAGSRSRLRTPTRQVPGTPGASAASARPGAPSGPGGTFSSGTTGGRPPRGWRRWSWRRRTAYIAGGLVVALLATAGGTYAWADSQLNHTVDLGALPAQPPVGQGTNYLIAGSDNRQNLTTQQQQQLHTGSDNEGQYGNSDSMLILHVGANGDTLVSLPRDSYVTIPAFTGSSGKQYPATQHKLNTAFSWGGGQLLAQTVEYNTGIHIDHYAEIGFGGFVNLVNALGGVNMCLDKPMVDQASGANFKAGCQTFNGAQSLAFVRERHQEASQDLGRMANQQKFLAAVAHQAATPSTLLNPFKLYPALSAGMATLSVDKSMTPYDLAQMFFAMKDVQGGNGHSLTVPVGNANYYTPTDGDALLWDKTQAKTLFSELQNDQPVTIASNDATTAASGS
ncbi:LCP family protein required for cell wall assembly [Streptacidiphilus sp. BW17]|uniref:LCP family protein n=1 Tax=Streptacidiphilus sp. BW17 TaxID=3156274 RepID=UPI003518F2D7